MSDLPTTAQRLVIASLTSSCAIYVHVDESSAINGSMRQCHGTISNGLSRTYGRLSRPVIRPPRADQRRTSPQKFDTEYQRKLRAVELLCGNSKTAADPDSDHQKGEIISARPLRTSKPVFGTRLYPDMQGKCGGKAGLLETLMRAADQKHFVTPSSSRISRSPFRSFLLAPKNCTPISKIRHEPSGKQGALP